ncbi:peptidoglycan-binding protein [Tianweitania sp. BSSL-BM11]|uniref:Peptidoglycan-binding protein n=1 Tax=Tianweitania aestuarii TaxID=2814886 RepID=A0ABS5RS32_9HYPH|nr:peptidoglycan-binding protein [Tianweitania aestuarii]MBS9719871.1 peptidoglycan-binding protein [Tianweitania aestuarii]
MARKTQKPTARARKQPAAPERAPVADSFVRRAAAAGGAAVARNPMMVGGTTAFMIALFFVSANAMWYQPHFHKGAFFPTRDLPQNALPLEGEAPRQAEPTTGSVEPQGDPTVLQVQTVLQDLKLYRGEIDGRLGTDTAEAILTYQKIVGQPMTGEIDDGLLSQLGVSTSTASIRPTASPAAPVSDPTTRAHEAGTDAVVASGLPTHERISRIQAGLRAFGNESVEIDGMVGTKTRNAIREFQSLFGLDVTGEPDEELYAKMREIGLTS